MLFLQQNGEKKERERKKSFMLDSVGGNTAAWLERQKSVNVLSGKIESCIKMAVKGGFPQLIIMM